MDELINQITSRTGLSDDQAREVVDTVISFAKSRLPEPLASQIDGLLGDSPDEAMEQLQQGLGLLGSMFGRQ